MNIKDNFEIFKKFNLIKTELINLNEKEENPIITMLISLCDDYQNLSVSDLDETAKKILNYIEIIKKDKNLRLQYKEDLLSVLKKLENLLTQLTVDNIIESVQL